MEHLLDALLKAFIPAAAVLLALVAGAVWIGSYMGPLGEKRAERTGQEEMVAENGILSPEEGLRTDAGPGNGMGAASLEGAETVPAEGVRLELTERKDACPYVELSFRVIEETGEPRTFSSDPADIPLRAEFDTEELVNWGCFAKTADKENISK